MLRKKKILLSGGGTAGSVSPLLAIADEIRSRDDKGNFEFLWVGTRQGIEKRMVEKEGIMFKSIFSGKLRRYFNWKNITDIALLKLGFWQSFFIMLRWRPILVISAGGFVSVPVVWAAWILRIPCLIHQQDFRPGLANKLMAPFAKIVTVTFEKSLNDYGKKAVWTGNPVRKSLSEPSIPSSFNLKPGLPSILIVGGGTGAMFINQLVSDSIHDLLKFSQVIHVTGKNKNSSINSGSPVKMKNYQCYEFLPADKMAEAERIADLVITRAGMSFLSELSILAKPIIIIPIPDSHQEDNAKIYADHEAAVVLSQKSLTPEVLINKIENLLSNPAIMAGLKNNISQLSKPRTREEIFRIIYKLIQ